MRPSKIDAGSDGKQLIYYNDGLIQTDSNALYNTNIHTDTMYI